MLNLATSSLLVLQPAMMCIHRQASRDQEVCASSHVSKPSLIAPAQLCFIDKQKARYEGGVSSKLEAGNRHAAKRPAEGAFVDSGDHSS